MLSFAQIDAQYRDAIEAPGKDLTRAMDLARKYPFNLTGSDINTSVLLKLKSFFLAQALIKKELNKVYASSAADFFVETISFFLKVILETALPLHTVASEKNLVNKRGAMRPDISVWKGEEIVVAIECKTQLGWNRDGWLDEFLEREQRLHKINPNAKLFLLVMTASNWSGFGTDNRAGNQFFVLLNTIWPDAFESDETNSGHIVHRVEDLFKKIIEHANG